MFQNKVIFEVIFPLLFAQSWRPRLWAGRGGGSLESKQQRRRWRQQKTQQIAGQEKPPTSWSSAGAGVDDCIIGSCRGETGIFRWNKNEDERSTQQTTSTNKGCEDNWVWAAAGFYDYNQVGLFPCHGSVITGCVFHNDSYVTRSTIGTISEPRLTYCMFEGISHVLPPHPLALAWAGLADNPKWKRICRFSWRSKNDATPLRERRLQTWHILTNNLSHSIHNTRENTPRVHSSARTSLSLCTHTHTHTLNYIRNISWSVPVNEEYPEFLAACKGSK